MNTEQKLKKLFDYQRFEKNPRLKQMINAAEGDIEELPDEALFFVNAAGEIKNDLGIGSDESGVFNKGDF